MRFGVGAICPALSAVRMTVGGSEDELERPQVLLLPEKLLIRVAPCRAGLAQLREPALDLAARPRQSGGVGLELVRGERLRVRGRETRRDVRLAVVRRRT